MNVRYELFAVSDTTSLFIQVASIENVPELLLYQKLASLTPCHVILFTDSQAAATTIRPNCFCASFKSAALLTR